MSPYFYLLGRFWEEHDRAPLRCGATALYFRLLHEANRSFWKGPLSLSWAYLERVLGVGPNTLGRAISDLKSRGLITYKRGKRRSEFWFPNHYQNDRTYDSTNDSDGDFKHEGISYKDYKTLRQKKEGNNLVSDSCAPCKEIARLYEKYFSKPADISEFTAKLLKERYTENPELDWEDFLKFASKNRDYEIQQIFFSRAFYKLLNEYKEHKSDLEKIRKIKEIEERSGKLIHMGELIRGE